PDSPVMLPAPETRMVVLDALATLPPRSRAVVVLRYWVDLSVDQAADVLGCSPGTVKTLGARALDKLRGVLGDALTDPVADPEPLRQLRGNGQQAKEPWHGGQAGARGAGPRSGRRAADRAGRAERTGSGDQAAPPPPDPRCRHRNRSRGGHCRGHPGRPG